MASVLTAAAVVVAVAAASFATMLFSMAWAAALLEALLTWSGLGLG